MHEVFLCAWESFLVQIHSSFSWICTSTRVVVSVCFLRSLMANLRVIVSSEAQHWQLVDQKGWLLECNHQLVHHDSYLLKAVLEVFARHLDDCSKQIGWLEITKKENSCTVCLKPNRFADSVSDGKKKSIVPSLQHDTWHCRWYPKHHYYQKKCFIASEWEEAAIYKCIQARQQRHRQI